MESKREVLRRYMATGQWYRALGLAAKFPRLGVHKLAIQRGWAAYKSPELYQQMGHQPQQLIKDGIDALQQRYGKGDQ